jgi:predicted TIM-barrel fold metal-dependent hydrolase
VIDAHNHLGRWLSPTGDWIVPDVDGVLAVMDASSVELVVNLDGRWGQELEANLDRYDRAHPERFATFCHVDWSALGQDDTSTSQVERMTRQLQASVASGARGVKVWKDLGLEIRDAAGELVPPDDGRVVAVLRAAGELGLPVLIHTADPVAFFEPLTPQNERFDELQVHPEWWFGAPGYPTFAELIAALDRLLEACCGTTFVGAHVGCWAEDLDAVGGMLSSHPQWNIDLGGRLGEIGRRPAAFRRLVEAFPDRVLLGTDCFPPTVGDYARYRRFLETDDVAFDYSGEPTPPQGVWTIDGAALDPALLPALYSGNARRLLSLTD